MSLAQFSTRYPVTIGMATLAVVLLGLISFDRLGTDLLPDLQTPVVTIDLRAPGKAPREMEERYTRRIERDISTVRQVNRVYSVTRSGQAVVVAEFSWDADMDFALLDVQKKVASYAADEEITTLDVTREDPQASSVMRLAIVDDGNDLDALVGMVDALVKPKLESLEGVASAEREGGTEKEIRVTLDPYLLEAFGLTPSAVVDRIQAANSDIAGGTLREGQQSYIVKALGRLKDADDVNELIVGERRESGSSTEGYRVPIRVKDIATVGLVYQEADALVRLNGKLCVGLAIYKEAGSNTVSVVNTVNGALENLSSDLPGLEFVVIENQAKFITDAIGEVEESALVGALLAILVLMIALRNITATLVIGVAIPISILGTFTLMYFQDLTLNIMTLGGLALGAGMLVDNAIVVIENIFRHLEMGEDAQTASANGASEVGVAILASTLTTVSVFLPIVYVQGLAGELFQDQAWTVVYSLMCSLVVAMTTVPMLTTRLFGRANITTRTRKQNWYGQFLSGVLQQKFSTAMCTVGVVLVALYLFERLDTEFIPREDQGVFQIDVHLPEGSRLELTDRVAHRIGDIVNEAGAEAVSAVYIRSGVDPSRLTGAGDPTGPNRASVIVAMHSEHTLPIGDFIKTIDPHVRNIPEVEIEYQLHQSALEDVMGGEEAPIQVEITGDNIDILTRLTAQLAEKLNHLSSVYNVQTSFEGGQPEIDLDIREEVAAAFGLNSQMISRTLERQLSGEIAGELSKDQRTRNIRVKYEDVDLNALGHIRIEGSGGAILTLADVADMHIIEGPREIHREGQRRVARISGYIPEGIYLSSAVRDVQEVIAETVLPGGYRIHMGGEERQRAESFDSLKFALILSIVLVYMVMASLFESLLHPFTVMFSVPLAGIGVVFAFWGVQEPLSVMAYIGIIMLGGIAVNDAIVLVDRIQQLRTTVPLREAVLLGAQDRFRPILMTSATTILALLPMALGFGEGAKLRAPMAIAVIGGLVSSTLMTLVIIPVMYEAIESLRGRAKL